MTALWTGLENQPPLIPKRLHIITGAGSAALADMERLIADRWPDFSYTVVPVLVQGNEAPGQIVQSNKILSKSCGFDNYWKR